MSLLQHTASISDASCTALTSNLHSARVYTSFITPDVEVLGLLCSRVYPCVLSTCLCTAAGHRWRARKQSLETRMHNRFITVYLRKPNPVAARSKGVGL